MTTQLTNEYWADVRRANQRSLAFARRALVSLTREQRDQLSTDERHELAFGLTQMIRAGELSPDTLNAFYERISAKQVA